MTKRERDKGAMPEPVDRYERFQAPIVLEGPTLESVLAYLGVKRLPEVDQRRAVAQASADGKLFPLQVDLLRQLGWLD